MGEPLTILNEWKKRYNQDSLDFELSYGYLLQASRGSILEYYVNNDTIVLCYPRRVHNGSLNRDVFETVIISSAGKDPVTEISNLVKIKCKRTSNSCSDRIIIKNVGTSLEQELKKAGFEDYKEDEFWDSYSRYDDNTFPEQVINTQDICELNGPNYARLRSEIRRFNRRYNISISRYTPRLLEYDSELVDLTQLNALQMSRRKKIPKEQFIDANEMFTKCGVVPSELIARNAFKQYKIVDTERDLLIGFLCFSEISKKCLAWNSVIVDFSYKYIFRRVGYECAVIAKNLGYSYLNLQGSEDLAQHKSKRVFAAEIEIPKKHLVWRIK